MPQRLSDRARPLAVASCWPVAGVAASDAIRLTDEQRMAILDGNTAERAAELTGTERAGRGIHGEVGIMIGSRGTRGTYGIADIPLGENGGATISVESSRFGYRR